jgi:hypothetical protein
MLFQASPSSQPASLPKFISGISLPTSVSFNYSVLLNVRIHSTFVHWILRSILRTKLCLWGSEQGRHAQFIQGHGHTQYVLCTYENERVHPGCQVSRCRVPSMSHWQSESSRYVDPASHDVVGLSQDLRRHTCTTL